MWQSETSRAFKNLKNPVYLNDTTHAFSNSKSVSGRQFNWCFSCQKLFKCYECLCIYCQDLDRIQLLWSKRNSELGMRLSSSTISSVNSGTVSLCVAPSVKDERLGLGRLGSVSCFRVCFSDGAILILPVLFN